MFTTDERHSVDHSDKGYKWNLVIKDVTKAHAGLYDCQISTKEDLVRRIRLSVTGNNLFMIILYWTVTFRIYQDFNIQRNKRLLVMNEHSFEIWAS